MKGKKTLEEEKRSGKGGIKRQIWAIFD